MTATSFLGKRCSPFQTAWVALIGQKTLCLHELEHELGGQNRNTGNLSLGPWMEPCLKLTAKHASYRAN